MIDKKSQMSCRPAPSSIECSTTKAQVPVRPQVAIFGHFCYFQYVWPCGHGLAISKILLKFLKILKII